MLIKNIQTARSLSQNPFIAPTGVWPGITLGLISYNDVGESNHHYKPRGLSYQKLPLIREEEQGAASLVNTYSL